MKPDVALTKNALLKIPVVCICPKFSIWLSLGIGIKKNELVSKFPKFFLSLMDTLTFVLESGKVEFVSQLPHIPTDFGKVV